MVCLIVSYRPPSSLLLLPSPFQVLMGHLYERHDGRPPHVAIVVAGMVSSSIAQVGARDGRVQRHKSSGEWEGHQQGSATLFELRVQRAV